MKLYEFVTSRTSADYWNYRAYLGKEFNPVFDDSNNNQFKYLFGLLTQTSPYNNSKGNAEWAKGQLLDKYDEWQMASLLEATALGGSMAFGLGNTKSTTKPKYVPKDNDGEKLGLPKNKDGKLVNGTSHKPDSMNPHTQIGIKKGRKGEYIQTLEWGRNGRPIQRTDWTDHGRGDHINPHSHPAIFKDGSWSFKE